jgi:hypothetical protein
LKKVTKATGLSLQVVVQALIEGPLVKVEAGGSIMINATTGEVSIGAAPLPVTALQAQAQGSSQSFEEFKKELEEKQEGRFGETRKIDMRIPKDG